MIGTQAVIPAKVKRNILEIICEGHLGMTKTEGRAREAVFWPCMNSQG